MIRQNDFRGMSGGQDGLGGGSSEHKPYVTPSQQQAPNPNPAGSLAAGMTPSQPAAQSRPQQQSISPIQMPQMPQMNGGGPIQPMQRPESTPLQTSPTQIPGSALVENRLNGLLNQDNAYMQQAQTQGAQQAAQRGLLNSSMGIGAVEQARIAAALPIAQQDASLYGQASLQDSGFTNQGALNQQQFGHNVSLNQQNFGNQSQLNQQQAAINMQSQGQQNMFQTGQNQLQSMTNIDQQLASELGAIERDPNIPAEVKQQQIAALHGIYNERRQATNQAFQQQAQQYTQAFSTSLQGINSRFQFRG